MAYAYNSRFLALDIGTFEIQECSSLDGSLSWFEVNGKPFNNIAEVEFYLRRSYPVCRR